jgi:hypothetical protein
MWAPPGAWVTPAMCTERVLSRKTKKDVIGQQVAGRPDFNRKEIRGNHHLLMRFQKRPPRSAFLPIRCQFYAMPFQDILDRVRCNDVTEISESALDSVITPRGILARHADYQFGDL